MTIQEELKKKNETVFPNGKIITLDGMTLDCYPTAEGNSDIADDQIKLDTTGRYLAIGRRLKPEPPTSKEVEEQQELFINNAFYLLAHKKRIMSDSRMFLCPVAMRNGLAYTGTSGFTRPTLGIYLEWWSIAPDAMQTDKKGRKMLVYHIAGSPLSGGNHCAAIRDDGKRETVTLLPFSTHWRPFTLINTRYNEAKYMYQAFSLQDVLDILHEEDNGNTDFSQDIEIQHMTHEIDRLHRQLEIVEERCNRWQSKCSECISKYHAKRMLDYYALYEEAIAGANTEIEKIKELKKALKAELKNGKLDNNTYQRMVTSLNKKINELETEVRSYKFDKVREAFPDEENITFNTIEKFVLASRKQENEN